jgi:hypothetical protein
MRLLATLALALALLAAAGCDDRSYREIGAAIDVLVRKNNDLPGPAIERLRKIGRRAVPQIETAMHTASPRGKVNLIAALAAIGEPEAAAILQHFGVYDQNPEVRQACEETLAAWATGSDPKAVAAQQALARLAEKRRL